MYQVACASPLELTAHKYWWQAVDDMSLGSNFRMELEQLARRSARRIGGYLYLRRRIDVPTSPRMMSERVRMTMRMVQMWSS